MDKLERKLSALYLVSLVFCGLSFFVMVFILAQHNRVAADDYRTVAETLNQGILLTAWRTYLSWIGRWSALLTSSFFALLARDTGSLLAFTWATYVYFAISVCALVESVYRATALSGGSRPPLGIRIGLGVFFAHLLFFLTPNTRESFNWLSGATCYGWGVSHWILCLAFWVGALTGVRKAAIASALFAMLASSANEPLGIYIVVALGGAAALFWIAGQRERAISTSWCWLGSLLGFVIMALSPGNQARSSHYIQPPLSEVAQRVMLIPWQFTSQYVYSHWMWLVGTLLFGFFLAASSVSSRRGMTPAKVLVGASACFVFIEASNWILMFPAVYLGGHPPPDRSWISNSTMMFFALIGLGAWLGFLHGPLQRSTRLALQFGFVVMICGLGGFRLSLTQRMMPGISAYTEAYDQRMTLLRTYQAQDRRDPLELKRLPYQDILFYVEWDVADISEAFKLPFKTVAGQ